MLVVVWELNEKLFSRSGVGFRQVHPNTVGGSRLPVRCLDQGPYWLYQRSL